MPATRANVEATKGFFRPRFGNPYIYGGALSPTNVKQGTDCSEAVQTACELVLGRYVPGRQSEGATTESYRPKTMGGPIPIGGRGPFGTIVVGRWQDVPADAVVKIGLKHGPGGGQNSHMWCEVDNMRIESRGGGVGLITNPRAFAYNDGYANSWAYLPGPITEDGTPQAPEVVILGRAYESYGERVKQLQLRLNTVGAALDADGEFGPLTEDAVRAYQRGHGLEVDGVAGPVTLAALGLTFGGPAAPPPVVAPDSMVALLRRAMSPTEQPNARLAELLPFFGEAMRAAEINTVKRAAAWCSQIGHESSGLRYMAEIQTNGPGWSDDRRIYRGRGPIQLTWSSNYRKFGKWCAARGYVTDPELFVKQPTLVEQPRWGFLAASWYWLNDGPKPGRINEFADAGDILAVSACVNGWIPQPDGRPKTPIGMDDRRARYLSCMAIGDQLLDLARPAVPNDPLEELLMSQPVDSWSIYATPGEDKIPPLNLVRAIDAYIHKVDTDAEARAGDPEAIRRLARTAAGLGTEIGRRPGAVAHAVNVLNEIYATNPQAIINATGKA